MRILTLAEFLGWEKDTDYEFDDYMYKVQNGYVYEKLKNSVEPYKKANLRLCNSTIKRLRGAKKIEKKYNVRLKKVTKKEFEEIKKIADIFELEEE